MHAQVHQYSLTRRLIFNDRKTVFLTFSDDKRLSQNREWSIGGKKIMEKSVWHNLGKKFGRHILIVVFQLWKPPSPVKQMV